MKIDLSKEDIILAIDAVETRRFVIKNIWQQDYPGMAEEEYRELEILKLKLEQAKENEDE